MVLTYSGQSGFFESAIGCVYDVNVLSVLSGLLPGINETMPERASETKYPSKKESADVSSFVNHTTK